MVAISRPFSKRPKHCRGPSHRDTISKCVPHQSHPNTVLWFSRRLVPISSCSIAKLSLKTHGDTSNTFWVWDLKSKVLHHGCSNPSLSLWLLSAKYKWIQIAFLGSVKIEPTSSPIVLVQLPSACCVPIAPYARGCLNVLCRGVYLIEVRTYLFVFYNVPHTWTQY